MPIKSYKDVNKEIKSFLMNSNYPGSSLLTEDEIKFVISLENRIQFLTWVFEELNENVMPQNIEKKLPRYLFQHGFCTKKENEKFVFGNKGFTFQNEFPIFCRIFEKLISVNLMKSKQENVYDNKIEVKDFELNINKKINILPSYMPRQKNYFEKRETNINEYKRKIELLKLELSNLEDSFAITNEPVEDTNISNLQSSRDELKNENKMFLQNFSIFDIAGDYENNEKPDEMSQIIGSLDEKLQIVSELPTVYDGMSLEAAEENSYSSLMKAEFNEQCLLVANILKTLSK